MTAPVAGGCLCGAVRFTLEGDLRGVVVCHCSLCRRWGTYAGAYTRVARAGLRLISAETLTLYVDANGRERSFCRACGTSLFWAVPGEDGVSVSAGALDDGDHLRLARHIHVAGAAAWEPPPTGGPRHPRGSDSPPSFSE